MRTRPIIATAAATLVVAALVAIPRVAGAATGNLAPYGLATASSSESAAIPASSTVSVRSTADAAETSDSWLVTVKSASAPASMPCSASSRLCVSWYAADITSEDAAWT